MLACALYDGFQACTLRDRCRDLSWCLQRVFHFCIFYNFLPAHLLPPLFFFGCVHPSAPTRMPADTALPVHDRGCSLQGPSHGLSDLALPASQAARPSRWQLASFVIMVTAPAASKWRWMSQSWMSRFQRHILHRHDQVDHAGSGCAHLACRSRTDGGTEVILRLC